MPFCGWCFPYQQSMRAITRTDAEMYRHCSNLHSKLPSRLDNARQQRRRIKFLLCDSGWSFHSDVHASKSQECHVYLSGNDYRSPWISSGALLFSLVGDSRALHTRAVRESARGVVLVYGKHGFLMVQKSVVLCFHRIRSSVASVTWVGPSDTTPGAYACTGGGMGLPETVGELIQFLQATNRVHFSLSYCENYDYARHSSGAAIGVYSPRLAP